jgi:hypothetical protein
MAGLIKDTYMIDIKNWKELALNKKACNYLVEQVKTHKVL